MTGGVWVLGAGIQGVCAALALAGRGHRVTVVDAAPDCLQGASLRNEGKIHLGFVYANDPTGATPTLMLDGALAFADLLERFTGGPLPWDRLRSRPFTYLVLPDSLLAPDAIAAAFTRLDDALAARGPARYLGAPIAELWAPEPVAGVAAWANPDRVVAAMRTAEASVDRVGIAAHLRGALHAHPHVTVRYGHRVHEARRTPNGFALAGRRADGEAWRADAEVAVNCLWDQRLALDAEVGLPPGPPWVHRRKYRVLGRLPAGLDVLPSVTMVLGRYGDVVVHPGHPAYASWYPVCLAGWSTDLAPPTDWADESPDGAGAAAAGDGAAAATEVARATVAGIAGVIPAFAGFEVLDVAAGVIVARGETDIDDPASGLHARTGIGVHSHDGWFSVDTGKYTTAPLFAAQLAEQVGPAR